MEKSALLQVKQQREQKSIPGEPGSKICYPGPERKMLFPPFGGTDSFEHLLC